MRLFVWFAKIDIDECIYFMKSCFNKRHPIHLNSQLAKPWFSLTSFALLWSTCFMGWSDKKKEKRIRQLCLPKKTYIKLWYWKWEKCYLEIPHSSVWIHLPALHSLTDHVCEHLQTLNGVVSVNIFLKVVFFSSLAIDWSICLCWSAWNFTVCPFIEVLLVN